MISKNYSRKTENREKNINSQKFRKPKLLILAFARFVKIRNRVQS